jgi:hypothetical protein
MIRTVGEPKMMASSPVGFAQVHRSDMRAAGSPPISTVGAPGGMIGIGAPMQMAHVCMSVTRAAGSPGMTIPFSNQSQKAKPARAKLSSQA